MAIKFTTRDPAKEAADADKARLAEKAKAAARAAAPRKEGDDGPFETDAPKSARRGKRK
jgi:hypothetical protein